MNRSFAYSGSHPLFQQTNIDYSLLKNGLPKPLPEDQVFQALLFFVFTSWGRHPTSKSVVKSLRGIEKASKYAPTLKKIFMAFNAVNSEAWSELTDALCPLLQNWIQKDFDRNALLALSTRLPLIADAAGRAAQNVYTLPRGRPGKDEFSSLVLRLRKPFESAGGKSWYNSKSDYDEANDSDVNAVGGPFVTFVCEAVRQIKPYLRGAPVTGLLPNGIKVNTNKISDKEQNAIGKAIKDMKAIKAVRQQQKKGTKRQPVKRRRINATEKTVRARSTRGRK